MAEMAITTVEQNKNFSPVVKIKQLSLTFANLSPGGSDGGCTLLAETIFGLVKISKHETYIPTT